MLHSILLKYVFHLEAEILKGPHGINCIFAPFPASIFARKLHLHPIGLIAQIMYVLLMKVKELVISLKFSSTVGHI